MLLPSLSRLGPPAKKKSATVCFSRKTHRQPSAPRKLIFGACGGLCFFHFFSAPAAGLFFPNETSFWETPLRIKEKASDRWGNWISGPNPAAEFGCAGVCVLFFFGKWFRQMISELFAEIICPEPTRAQELMGKWFRQIIPKSFAEIICPAPEPRS